MIDPSQGILEEHYNELYGVEGWTYRELPYMLFEYWDEILDTIGSGNIHIISGSIRQQIHNGEYRSFRRATILISPEGMENASKEYESLRT